MITMYDKEERVFKGYKDLGVLSGITGRTVAWLQRLRALGVVVEDDRYVLGYLHEVKSTRGGQRVVAEGSDEDIMDKLDGDVYKSFEEKESGVLDYREGRPVKFIKSLEE